MLSGGLGDPATWLQQTIQHILTDFLSGLANDFGDAIVGFINDVNFLTHTPENLSYTTISSSSSPPPPRYWRTACWRSWCWSVATTSCCGRIWARPTRGPLSSAPPATGRHPDQHRRVVVPPGDRRRTTPPAVSSARPTSPTWSQRCCGWSWSDPISGLLMLLIATSWPILLLIQQLMRLALVDVLFILAPWPRCCGSCPNARAWGRPVGTTVRRDVFAQAVQVLTLRLGFNLATGLPPLSAAGLLQPLLGIAVLALVLKIPRLMGGGGAGGNSSRL